MAASLIHTLTADPPILVCSSLLLCSLAALLFTYARARRPARGSLPPSPWRLPLIGNLHQLMAVADEGLQALSKKYGPILLMHLGSFPVCVISSGELARKITNTHDAVFSDRASTKASRILFSGENDLLFAPENKFWRLSRKLCVSALLSPTNVQALFYVRDEEVAKLVKLIRANGSVKAIDLSDLLLKLASSIVSRAVLGQTKVSGSAEDDNEVKGKLAIKVAHMISDLFSFEDFIPALSWVDHLTGLNRRLKKTAQEVHAFLDQVIDEHERNQSADDGPDKNDRKCFVNIMLEFQRKGMIGLDNLTRSDIRAIVLDMVLAGVGTTAAALEWTMAELAKNPSIMQKVQEEVRRVVGGKSKIQESDISQMKYLKCVIKEELRIHGPTIVGRKSTSSITIGGFKLPAGVSTWINLWVIHRDPAAWDRPFEFIPERFLDARYNYKGQDHVYFPFGLGRRICPGMEFAMAEVEYGVANLLCWFDWELPDGMRAEELDMRGSTSEPSYKIIPLRLVPVPVSKPASCS
uniref:Cytochrome P450 n=1 Tax=Kalanchoe fedtschenkoi TaxID=63787 RepID=A0A7N0VCR7_KALFE